MGRKLRDLSSWCPFNTGLTVNMNMNQMNININNINININIININVININSEKVKSVHCGNNGNVLRKRHVSNQPHRLMKTSSNSSRNYHLPIVHTTMNNNHIFNNKLNVIVDNFAFPWCYPFITITLFCI